MLGPFIPPSFAAHYMLNPRLRAADGVGWEETCAAWDQWKANERSYGRPPQWQPGDDRTEYTRSRSYARSHDHLTH